MPVFQPNHQFCHGERSMEAPMWPLNMAGKGLGWRLTWRGCGLRCHLTWNERPMLEFNMAGKRPMLQLNMAGKRRLQILSSNRAHHPLAF